MIVDNLKRIGTVHTKARGWLLVAVVLFGIEILLCIAAPHVLRHPGPPRRLGILTPSLVTGYVIDRVHADGTNYP